MARAKRHYIPGYIWHITHRCHKREFLLGFSKDRHRYLQWLYQAKKRYGLTILNYIVTSNHVHLEKQGRTSDYQFPIFATPVTTEKLERIDKSERAILSFEF